MKTYILVTNDAFEHPVSEEIVGSEATARRLGITAQRLYWCLCNGFPRKAKYKAVVIAERQHEDVKEYHQRVNKHYAMTHDRTEYYRQYARRRKAKCRTDQCLQITS